MLKWLSRGLVALIVIVTAASIALSVLSYVQRQATLRAMADVAQPAPYTITRDAFGVPTISGDTDPATAYGLAYAHSEDDFATIQRRLLAVRGELGAVDGREGLEADFFGKLIDAHGQTLAGLDKVSPEARAMADAYAAGVNRYAVDHPDEILRHQIFPVTGTDVIEGFVLVSPLFFGVDEAVARVFTGKLPARSVSPEERGSNAFAFAPSRTADGSTVLVSNSHQPWEGPAAWYEATVESKDGWRMTGGLFPGSPVVLMGHNDHLGWTNTVNRPDLSDIYELTLDASGRNYKLDGDWKPLERRDVWLKLKLGPIVVPVRQTVWRSVHGPVLKTKAGAFAIRYAGYGETRQLEQYYRLNRTRSFDDWTSVMSMQAIPGANFVYADASGNIALLHNARSPKRDPKINWSGVLPGDRSDLIWTEYEPFKRLPFLINPPSGYLINANNTPFLATAPADDMSPESYPDLVGVESWVTNRILRARALVDADTSLTRAEIEAIKFDTRYDPSSVIGAEIQKVISLSSVDTDLADAHALLKTWDWTQDGAGRADSLAAIILGTIQWSRMRAEDIPSPEDLLRRANDHLRTHFGRVDAPLGDVLRLRRGTIDVPVYGGPDALRAIGWKFADDGRLVADSGDSFVMIVTWDKDGRVSSDRIQPFGAASGRPDSPHYDDQAEPFSKLQFRPRTPE